MRRSGSPCRREPDALRVIGDGLLLGPARGRYAPTEVFNVVLLNVEVEGANADTSLDGAHGVLPPGRDGEPGGACRPGAGPHPTLLLLCGSAQAFAGPTQSAGQTRAPRCPKGVLRCPLLIWLSGAVFGAEEGHDGAPCGAPQVRARRAD